MVAVHQYWKTWWALFRADMWSFRRVLLGRLGNFLFWCTANICVPGYLMLSFGTAPTFGPFVMVGTWAMAGMLDVSGRFSELVDDFCGSGSYLSRYGSYPLPRMLLMFNLMITTACRIGIIGLCAIPLGLFLLPGRYDASIISVPKLCLLLPLIYLFYGAATVLVASSVHHINGIPHLIIRLFFPLWFLGGFQFSQAALMKIAPYLGYINYANPIMYMFEGLRGAFFGDEVYVAFLTCAIALAVATLCVYAIGIRKCIQRLDLA